METDRLIERLTDYSKAVNRLQEALNTDGNNPLIYDATIQRFEFTYELAWKLLKAYLIYLGIAEGNNPRDVFKEAFTAGLISNHELWTEMIKDRNLTSHTYDEAEAIRIFGRIKGNYLHVFKELMDKMDGEIGE